MLFLKILAGIVVYLLIGVFVTQAAFRGKSIHVGAAPVIYIMPLIWPVTLVGMAEEAIDEYKSKKEADRRAIKLYEEQMAACPPGYEKPLSLYYSTKRPVLQGKVRVSTEEARQDLIRELMAGNFPADPALRKDILDAASYIFHDDAEKMQASLQPLLSAEAPPLANYTAGYVLVRDKIHYITYERVREDDKPSAVLLLHAIIPAWERYLAAEPSALGPLAMASLYEALIKCLPAGEEREAALRQGREVARQAALEASSYEEMLLAFYVFVRMQPAHSELEALSAELLTQRKAGRVWAEYAPDYDLLPLSWLHRPFHFDDYRLRDILEEQILPPMPDEAARLAVARSLVPLLDISRRHTFENYWREFLYNRYQKSGDLGWVDLFLRLAEERVASAPAVTDGDDKLRRQLLFFRAENAFMHGNEEAARELLHEYYAYYESFAGSLILNGWDWEKDWSNSEQGKAFANLNAKAMLRKPEKSFGE